MVRGTLTIGMAATRAAVTAALLCMGPMLLRKHKQSSAHGPSQLR